VIVHPSLSHLLLCFGMETKAALQSWQGQTGKGCVSCCSQQGRKATFLACVSASFFTCPPSPPSSLALGNPGRGVDNLEPLHEAGSCGAYLGPLAHLAPTAAPGSLPKEQQNRQQGHRKRLWIRSFLEEGRVLGFELRALCLRGGSPPLETTHPPSTFCFSYGLG
jgi:hypothetical protein